MFNPGTFGVTNPTQQQPQPIRFPQFNTNPAPAQNTIFGAPATTTPTTISFGIANNQQPSGMFNQTPQQQPIFPQPQQSFSFNTNQTATAQPTNFFGTPVAQQQPAQILQPQYTCEQIAIYIQQLEAEIRRLSQVPAQAPVQQNPQGFPYSNNAVSIPAFLENGSPIVMQVPMGRASSLALMQGYRPMSTPQGIQFYPPENHPRYPDSPLNWLGYDRGHQHQRLGRSPSYHSLNNSRSVHYLTPSRQQGSTCLADPFIDPMDRPHFLRPYTAPVLSSPSSTSILFDDRRNPDLKMRTLSWRKGYGSHYPYGGPSDDNIIRRNYEAIVNDDMFGRRKKDKFNPTPQSWRDWKWKTLDSDVVDRRMRQDVTDRQRHGVTFFDDRDPNYMRTPERRQQGPPIRSHLDDDDRKYYSDLWFSHNRKTPEIVGNLPGKFREAPHKGILRNGGKITEEKTSPVFFSYKQSDSSRKPISHSTQTPCSTCNNQHAWISPLRDCPSAAVIEVFRASNRPPSFRTQNEKMMQYFQTH